MPTGTPEKRRASFIRPTGYGAADGIATNLRRPWAWPGQQIRPR
jgi:hypothetical protein